MPRKNRNPDQSVNDARAKFMEINGGVEPEAITVRAPSVPDTLVLIGEVVSIVYRAPKNSTKEGDYEHEWGDTGSRKLNTLHYFCTDATGRNFYLVPGNNNKGYPVTNERGVVG